MSQILLQNVPEEMYEQLQQRAAVNGTTIEAETVDVIRKHLPNTTPIDMPRPGESMKVKAKPGGLRLPDPPVITEEGPPPFDLPRLDKGVKVKAKSGGIRLPDPPIFMKEPY